MKGVILAGGTGSRLRPMTSVIGKQLLPVYDKPMIYYPLSTLILAGARDILIIVNPHERVLFEKMLGDGNNLGITIKFLEQQSPAGLADGVRLCREFIDEDEQFIFVLGDNLFFGPTFGANLKSLLGYEGSTVLCYRVSTPKDYGVVEFDMSGEVRSLVEKPTATISNWAIPGLYIFDNKVFDLIPKLSPSKRGELEIIDLLTEYLNINQLSVVKSSRGNAWFDLGTPDSLLSAANYVQSIQSRQGLLIGSPEESSLAMNNINLVQFENVISALPDCAYKNSLADIMSSYAERV